MPKPLPLGEVAAKQTERASPSPKSIYTAIRTGFCQSDAIAVFLFFCNGLALSVSLRSPRPGCGSQRLLRCRLHPAGRCPNSSSLFPPLAAVVAVAPCRGASGEEGKLCDMPKPPLDRGGGIAQAMTERFSPKRPLFQPEEGAFVILLLFYQSLRRSECVLRHADPHNPAGSRGSLPAGCWRLPEPAYPRSRRQRSWRRWT